MICCAGFSPLIQRKSGHNEMDEPAFTQPLMYNRIRSLPSLYTSFSTEYNCPIEDDYSLQLADALEASYSYSPVLDAFQGKWTGFSIPTKSNSTPQTGVNIDELKRISQQSTTLPPTFVSLVQPRLSIHVS